MKIKNKFILRVGICLALLLLVSPLKNFAQNCVSCGTVITANSGANITLNSGASLCIAAGVTYSGNITLNGGTLCNEGTVTNITFNKGTFNNYNLFNRTGAINVNSSGDVTINCFKAAQIMVSGAFNFAANNAAYNLNMNLNQGSRFIVNGAINASKGNFILNVGGYDPLSSISETIFNVGGQFNVSNTSLNFTIEGKSYVNVNGVMSLDNKLNKTIVNNGSFNINNSFNIGGNGQNSGVVTITNNYLFNISNFFNSSYTNGTVTVNNNQNFSIGKSLTLSKDNNNFINNVALNVVQDINAERGSIINNGTTTARDLDIKFGVYTNNSVTLADRDLITSNSAAIVNNNGYINVNHEVNNKATVNLLQGSLLQTNSYYNLGANAIINGPVSVPDTNSYAKIIIAGTSENTGYINGRIIVYDQSLISNASNLNYGFDQITNPARISSTVVFAAKAVGPPNGPPFVNCGAIAALYKISFIGAPYIACPNKAFTMQAQLQHIVTTNNGTFAVNAPAATNSYTWQPNSIIGNIISQNISANTTYTVYVKLANGCVISNTLSVILDMTGAPTITYPGSPYTYALPNALTFPVTLSNPFPGSVYSALPAGLNINSITGLVTAQGSTFGTYTVTYTTPESGDCFSSYTATTVIQLIDINAQCNLVIGFGNIIEPYLCEGDQIQVLTTGGANSYSWTPSTGLSCTNCPNPVITFTPNITLYTLNYVVNNYSCPAKTLLVFKKEDCADNSIVGCCFSNYGVSVFVHNPTTYLNVYCNVLNEVANLVPPTTISKGKFESTGNITLTKDWIHNGQNKLFEIPYAFSLDPLAVRQGTTSFIGNLDQNIKGNSNTYFNKLILAGNGKRIIWINTYATSDLDLTSNEFVIQGFNFFMKNENANIFRTSGYASSLKTGYFSRVLASNTSAPSKTYLYPLGSPATINSPYRYRPLELMNNKGTISDEVSANFVNASPALNDIDFVNTNNFITNVVTDKSPSILYRNALYYHKLKNTQPSAQLSNIVLRDYFPAIDGNYNSLSEWQSSMTLGPDWWGVTPGVFSNYSISSNPGTFGMVYAASNGTLNFQGKPFSLASTGISVNTSSFGGPGNVITLTSSPSTGTTVNTSTVVTNNVPVVNTTTTTVIGPGVSVSTSTANGSTTTNTTIINSGVTTETTVVVVGTNTTVITTTTTPGVGGTTTNTVVTVAGNVTTVTTSTTTPTTGGVSSNTTIASVGTTTTTTVSVTTNNGNQSTTVYTITVVTPSGTVVQTQTCVTVASGTTQVTTCTLTPNVGPPVITSNVTSTVSSNVTPVSTFTNVYNPGPFVTNPNPLAADYYLNIASLNNCILPGKVKFTVSANTTIDPNSVEFFDPVANVSLGNLSPSLFTITSPTLGIVLNSTPTDILAACSNSILVQTSLANDHIISNAGDVLSVNIPNLIGGFNVSTFVIYDYANNPGTPQNIFIGQNTPINTTSLSPGVYEFQFTLTLGATNHLIKGQFIKL